MKRIHPLWLLTVLAMLVSPVLAQAEPIDFAKTDPAELAYDNWYLESVDGRASGYWHEWLTIEDDHIVTGYESYDVESHGGEQMESRTRVVWTETKDFQLKSIVIQDEAGGQTVTKTYTFRQGGKGGVDLTTEQDDRKASRKLAPIQGKFLTAAQTAIAIETHLKRGDTSFSLDTLDPLAGMDPYVTTYTASPAPAKPFALADGSKVDANTWVLTYSILPGLEMLMQVDKDHRAVGLSYEISGMKIQSQLADESVTKTKFDPPEMAQLSVVVPDREIKYVDDQLKIVYELEYDGAKDVTPFNTHHQTVERISDTRSRVTVDLTAEQSAEARKADRPTDAHLEASIKIDHRDEEVRKLADRASKGLGKDTPPRVTAEAFQEFVTDFMTGNTLSVGDATASEAARSKSGDCTECSVLLAAMLRAKGIPARCVTGLVYSEDAFVGQSNVFVYHMWTQAWLQGVDGKHRWVDLDSAMLLYTAGHIALGVSDMGDNSQSDDIKLIPMMQNLKIKVTQIGDEQ